MFCPWFAFFVTLIISIATMAAGSNSDCKEYVLVRWIEDESVGVMPISAVAKGYNPSAGATIKMRWRGKKEYEAEILKISRT